MKYVAGRTCTAVNQDEEEIRTRKSGMPLEGLTETPAYVLIGEPGAGKTTAFKKEAEAQGGTYVTVRDFLTFDGKPEWSGTTLFLDGLDESRTGTIDGRTPLNQIRRNLDRLGSPPFRLSCRWAEWLGANDKDRLKGVSPDGAVLVIRLDPLTERNIKEILAKNHGVEDTDGFISKAKARGIDGLLTNPQTLELLAESVSGGEWPNSRKETFQQASRMLARETNEEHRLGNATSSDTGKLVEAAGRLCAVQVLTGIAGFTLPDRATPDIDYPSLEEIEGEVAGHSRQVLGTRMFVGASEGRFAPVHRQIAEFLAAHHIARLIDEGLPVKRVLSLVAGFDGELIPAFWNFSSWLAVHSKPSRPWLSQLNPSGLIYAGDEQTYSVEERQNIIKDLIRESSWNPSCSRSIFRSSGIGKIVSSELEANFHEILSDSDRSQEHQPYVMMLLQILADGEPLPGLSSRLQDIVVDSSWLPGVRCAALDVLISYNRNNCLETDVLVKLVDAIEEGTIEDSEDELIGILLKALYPETWSVSDIQRFLRMPKMDSATGEFIDFWTLHVPKASTPDQICDLLDLVASEFGEYRSFMTGEVSRHTRMEVLPVELLEKLRNGPWDAIEVDRLLRWLKVDSELRQSAPQSLTSTIAFGLGWNQDKLKELVAYAVETCLPDHDAWECAALVKRWLFGALPFDYGAWCFEKARGATDARVAAFYLGELIGCVSDGSLSGGLTIERIRARLAGNAALLALLDERMRQLEEPSPQGGGAHGRELATDTTDQIEWQQRVSAQAQELRAGRGEPRLLSRVAQAYLGIDRGVAGTTPSERLADLIGSRSDLVTVLQEGLENAAGRADLPSCSGVVRLFDKDQTDFLVLPFIAGLDSLERSGRLRVGELREEQIRLAVTILYTLPGQYLSPDTVKETALYRPGWFRTVLRDNPILVADVLQRCVELKHQTTIKPAAELYYLARDDDHREVASLAGLPLLEQFPNSDTEQAAWELRWLLKATLKNCDRSRVHQVVKGRLANRELAQSQKIYWLMAGYLAMPSLYSKEIGVLTEDSDAAFHGVWKFVFEGGFPTELTREFQVKESETLIVLIASSIERHGVTRDGYWTLPNLLSELASNPAPEASQALTRLSGEPSLAPFGSSVAEVKGRQARRRREHEFRHCDARQVTRTLANEHPANASDLVGLLMDVLEDLSKQIRDGSTSDWRQYWNVNPYNQPTNPKPEDACRDALLSDLRSHVGHLGIDAQPEGRYADDKRSDIRAGFGGFNAPVEIKRSCHSDLWTAIKSQLIPKYTRDPGAKGYGIYLVFWFGDADGCNPTKLEGWTPPNAAAVKAKLTELLSDQERHMISICVIDVSRSHN